MRDWASLRVREGLRRKGKPKLPLPDRALSTATITATATNACAMR